jgi:hypothetical protein
MIKAARAAGQAEVADESLQWLSEPSLLDVARRLHSDGAVLALDPGTQRQVFITAITDRQLKPRTSVSAIGELITLDDKGPRKDLRTALLAATKDPRCEVAAAALRALSSAAPRPATGSVPAALRALCVMANYVQEDADTDPGLRRFVSRQGLQVFDHASITDLPDEPNGEFIPAAELITLPFLEDLTSALEHCAGTTCRTTGLRFELSFDADRTLRRIERYAEPGACPERQQAFENRSSHDPG